jgi:DNA-directed RNA polymerase specialized sigma24 family protein
MRHQEAKRLYDDHVDVVFGFVAMLVTDRTVMEDATVETFQRANRAIHAFGWPDGDRDVWLVGIARQVIGEMTTTTGGQ